MSVHVDGARLWNAAVALGLPPSALTASLDSVAVCYSKGLGAPVGSAVAGDRDFTARARRARKLLGGGMRQAGVIAAGALHAIRHHLERLAEDHARARRLAEGLAGVAALDVDPTRVETNIVFARAPARADWIAEQLTQVGLGCLPFDADTIRFVTHLEIDDEDVERAIAIARSTLGVSD
jgi:threonine aldolase